MDVIRKCNFSTGRLKQITMYSFIHSYLFINKMQHKIYKNRIGVTEGQPGKQYALMVAHSINLSIELLHCIAASVY